MKQTNETIRKAARIAGVPHWKICKKLGISEPTFTRWLREPLSEEKTRQILCIISDIEKEGEN